MFPKALFGGGLARPICREPPAATSPEDKTYEMRHLNVANIS